MKKLWLTALIFILLASMVTAVTIDKYYNINSTGDYTYEVYEINRNFDDQGYKYSEGTFTFPQKLISEDKTYVTSLNQTVLLQNNGDYEYFYNGLYTTYMSDEIQNGKYDAKFESEVGW